MRLLVRLVATTLLVVSAFTAAAATELPADANTTCPVMQKEQAKPDLYVEHNGQRVYVCCVKCKKRFASDPDKYMARLREQDAATSASRKAVKPAN